MILVLFLLLGSFNFKTIVHVAFFVKTSILHYIVRIVFLSFALFTVRDSLRKHRTTVFKKSDITIQQKNAQDWKKMPPIL